MWIRGATKSWGVGRAEANVRKDSMMKAVVVRSVLEEYRGSKMFLG